MNFKRRCSWLHKTETGKFYLTLDPQTNFAHDSASTDTSSTTWHKIAFADTILDPDAITVEINMLDDTFTTGAKRPFAECLECSNSTWSSSKVNFTGTPFAVHQGADQFGVGGLFAQGWSTCQDGNKICESVCMGQCGSVSTVRALADEPVFVLDVIAQDNFGYCVSKFSRWFTVD